MKVIIILPCMARRPSGGYKVIYEYANKLAADNISVVFYYIPQNSLVHIKLPKKVCNVLEDVYLRIRGPRKWFDLNKRIKNRLLPKKITNSCKDTVIIATSIETVEPVLKSCIKNKVYFIQGFENWSYPDEEIYASYNAGMTNIVVAKWLKEIVDKHSLTPSYLVSNCIDTNIFMNKGLKRRKHSIVFHYRSADFKGPQYALDVIRKLEKNYNDLLVDVISIEDMPNELPSCCVFHHAITAKEIAEINNHSEIFMCTSIEEGFGLPGLEAMACGCAVVSSSYKGALEYAIDGENALLSPIRDVDTMVANITRLFENNELRERISENGTMTGKERSLEKSAEKFENILINNVF